MFYPLLIKFAIDSLMLRFHFALPASVSSPLYGNLGCFSIKPLINSGKTAVLENIYRTDWQGTIEFITDGERLWVRVGR